MREGPSKRETKLAERVAAGGASSHVSESGGTSRSTSAGTREGGPSSFLAGVGREPGGTGCVTRNEDMPGSFEQTPMVPLGWEEWPEARRTAMSRESMIAERVAAEDVEAVNDLGLDPVALEVAGFLFGKPDPSDVAFHDWAKAEGYEPDVAEAAAYRLATVFSSFLFGGRAQEKGVTVEDVDPVELAMGISVEMEHTTCFLVALRISLDHLAEIKNYYTRLKKMESEAGVED